MLPPKALLEVHLTIDGAEVPLEEAELYLSLDDTELGEDGRWVKAAHPDVQVMVSLRFTTAGSGLIARIPPQQLGLPIPPDDPPDYAVVVHQATAPKSQRLWVDAGRAEPPARALRATIHGPFPDQKAKLVTLSFDILVDITGIAQSADVATITVDPNGKRHSMAFELYAQGARIELAYPGPTGGTDYKEAGLTAFPIKDKWSRVSIHMNRTSPPSVSVSVDGASAGSMPLEPGFVNDGLRTRVGLSFAPGLKKGLSVRYDNVVVEVK